MLVNFIFLTFRRERRYLVVGLIGYTYAARCRSSVASIIGIATIPTVRLFHIFQLVTSRDPYHFVSHGILTGFIIDDLHIHLHESAILLPTISFINGRYIDILYCIGIHTRSNIQIRVRYFSRLFLNYSLPVTLTTLVFAE